MPGLDQVQFQGYADQAVKDCPVSRALAGIPEMVVSARLGVKRRHPAGQGVVHDAAGS